MAHHSNKKLARKIRSLEKKHAKTNPRARLTLAGIERLANKYQSRLAA